MYTSKCKIYFGFNDSSYELFMSPKWNKMKTKQSAMTRFHHEENLDLWNSAIQQEKLINTRRDENYTTSLKNCMKGKTDGH